MKNTLLNFEQFLVQSPENDITFILSDFTNFYWTNLSDKYKTDTKYYQNYQVSDGELLEGISNKLYNTPDRWDSILILNNIHSHLDLPKDSNTLEERTNILFNRWYQLNGFRKPEWFQEIKRNYFKNLVLQENERYRVIKVVKPSSMNDYMYDFLLIKKAYNKNTSSYSDTL